MADWDTFLITGVTHVLILSFIIEFMTAKRQSFTVSKSVNGLFFLYQDPGQTKGSRCKSESSALKFLLQQGRIRNAEAPGHKLLEPHPHRHTHTHTCTQSKFGIIDCYLLETPVANTGFTLTGYSLYNHKDGQNQHLWIYSIIQDLNIIAAMLS